MGVLMGVGYYVLVNGNKERLSMELELEEGDTK